MAVPLLGAKLAHAPSLLPTHASVADRVAMNAAYSEL
jgi:hypothetical protein